MNTGNWGKCPLVLHVPFYLPKKSASAHTQKHEMPNRFGQSWWPNLSYNERLLLYVSTAHVVRSQLGSKVLDGDVASILALKLPFAKTNIVLLNAWWYLVGTRVLKLTTVHVTALNRPRTLKQWAFFLADRIPNEPSQMPFGPLPGLTCFLLRHSIVLKMRVPLAGEPWYLEVHISNIRTGIFNVGSLATTGSIHRNLTTMFVLWLDNEKQWQENKYGYLNGLHLTAFNLRT